MGRVSSAILDFGVADNVGLDFWWNVNILRIVCIIMCKMVVVNIEKCVFYYDDWLARKQVRWPKLFLFSSETML